MICFQYNTILDKHYLIINNTNYPIYNYSHYKKILYLFSNFCSLKKLELRSLKVIFFGLFHILFIDKQTNQLVKLIYDDMTNIEEQFYLSKKSSSFGEIYDIFIIPETNAKIIIMENISAILSKNLIFKQKYPFIFLYSITLDYLNGLSVLHENGFIHSSIKPIQLLVSFNDIEYRNFQGKLVGLDDIIKTEPSIEYYYNTSGSINFLAPERYEYFENYGFFGKTSYQSDIWELFFSILNVIDIIVLDEFLDLLMNNFEILESYLMNRLVKCFKIDNSSELLLLVEKYIKVLVVGLRIKNRPPIKWYIEKLLGYKNL